eukprot:scaffold13926_cov58-Phaeocystis_antarctica.AAC.5
MGVVLVGRLGRCFRRGGRLAFLARGRICHPGMGRLQVCECNRLEASVIALSFESVTFAHL